MISDNIVLCDICCTNKQPYIQSNLWLTRHKTIQGISRQLKQVYSSREFPPRSFSEP